MSTILHHQILVFIGRPWVFGQHRDIVLPAVCHLLDNVAERFLKPSERGDPVRVARAISAVVSRKIEMYIKAKYWWDIGQPNTSEINALLIH